jgi:hypothetical protein
MKTLFNIVYGLLFVVTVIIFITATQIIIDNNKIETIINTINNDKFIESDGIDKRLKIFISCSTENMFIIDSNDEFITGVVSFEKIQNTQLKKFLKNECERLMLILNKDLK